MARTDLKIYATDPESGKQQMTSINYVNGSASSGTLKTLAQMINAFTENTYTKANRVNTLNVDTEDVPGGDGSGGLQSPALAKVSISTSALTLTFNGTGTPRLFLLNLQEDVTGGDGYCMEPTLTQTSADGVTHTYSLYGEDTSVAGYVEAVGAVNVICLIVLSNSEGYAKDWIMFAWQ